MYYYYYYCSYCTSYSNVGGNKNMASAGMYIGWEGKGWEQERPATRWEGGQMGVKNAEGLGRACSGTGRVPPCSLRLWRTRAFQHSGQHFVHLVLQLGQS